MESFMAEMAQKAKNERPAAQQPKPGLELDDDDNVADFLEVLSSDSTTLLSYAHVSTNFNRTEHYRAV